MHTFLDKQCGYNPQIPQIVFHYCTTDSMLKILENSCIWLSDVEKTNDKMELKYLGEKVKKIYAKNLEAYRGKYSEEHIKYIHECLDETLDNLLQNKAYISCITKQHIACFSECEDLLSQWRAYSNDGCGVAIGFDAKILSDLKNSYYFDFIKVIYENRKVFDNIEKYIKLNLKFILDNMKKNPTYEGNILDITLLVLPIWQESYAFKNPGFKEEQEWRVCKKQVGNYDEDDGKDDILLSGAYAAKVNMPNKMMCSPLKFRSSYSDIQSYYELNFEQCKNKIIKKVVIGPKCNIKKFDLKLLLRKYGYIDDVESECVEIVKSGIPYV